MRGVCRRDDTLTKISPTTVFVPDRRRGFGAASLSLGVDGVGIGHDDVGSLRCSASEFIWLLHQAAELRLAFESGFEHEHFAGKYDLRVRDGAMQFRHDQMRLKVERSAQPLDRSCRDSIAQDGNVARVHLSSSFGYQSVPRPAGVVSRITHSPDMSGASCESWPGSAVSLLPSLRQKWRMVPSVRAKML